MLDIIDTGDVTKSIIGAGVASGIIYAVFKRRGALGIFAYALGFGLIGLGAGTVISKITK